MREIKFRYWHKTHKLMLMDEAVTNYRYLNPEKYNLSFIIPMQYTGLLDKNGNEIYEGDIIKIFDEICIIEDIEDMYFNEQHPLVAYKNGIIIGNIYENKKLVKETK